MSPRALLRIAAGLLAGATILVALTASAASNTVPPTLLGTTQVLLSIAQLAPPQCAGMPLTSIVYGGSGGGGNDLILGTPASETLNGGGGHDCIVGGGGNDYLRGQAGNDVLIGGPGNFEILNGGSGNDSCYGNGAVFVWPMSCEGYYP